MNYKEMIQMNIKLFQIKPFLFIKNFLLWMCIALIPIINGALFSMIIRNIETNQNFYFLSAISGFLGVLLGYLIMKGGTVEVISEFTINQYIRKKHIMQLIKTKEERNDNGKYLDVLEVDINYFSILISAEIDLLCQLLFFLVSFIILSNINLTLTLIVYIPLLVMNYIVKKIGKGIKKRYAKTREVSYQVTSLLNQYIENMNISIFLDNENRLLTYMDQKIEERKTSSLKQVLLESCMDFLPIILQALTYLFILLGTVYVMQSTNITIDEIVLYVTYSANSFLFLGLFTEVYQVMKYLDNSVTEIEHDFNKNVEETFDVLFQETQKPKREFITKIEFINFKLKDENSAHVLNFKIEKGDKLLISGANGAVKRNFLKALLGEYDGYDGCIEWNGNKIFKDTYVIGYVDQNFTLFDETLDENINLCLQRKHTFVKELYLRDLSSEDIGNNGNKVSDGQRQRIAIARALTHGNDSILIFDHCFQMIDSATRVKVYNFILSSFNTVIFFENDCTLSENQHITKTIHFVNDKIHY